MKEQIIQFLPQSCHWQDCVLYLPVIDSTNTHAKKLAKLGSPHGTVVIADRQTGGRGRMGRQFHSPAGSGIYMSVILRPNCRPGEIMHLTCAAAVAMVEAIRQTTGVDVGIKWTNDLVAGRQKLGGILTELGLNANGSVDFAVLGVGINCTQKPEDFPPEIRSVATSLTCAAGKPPSLPRLAAAMIDSFFQMDSSLLTNRRDILCQYRKNCITLGQEISILRGDTVNHGKALDIDETGALIVQHNNGLVETVQSGEVSIRGMYGYV